MNKRTDKELERICRYCEFARTLLEENQMLCEKKGVVDAGYHCRRFCYDPLRRVPTRQVFLPSYGSEEFKL